ncbi:MAG: hypothetical protein A2Z81_03535 [Omnitrophica WOR_2 bacterium GWA2_45_18]|nr:MAG: hypothetical protein A2Z81_03535 [Omnitrophica WOR_2 bacterium GWA2_45_18]
MSDKFLFRQRLCPADIRVIDLFVIYRLDRDKVLRIKIGDKRGLEFEDIRRLKFGGPQVKPISVDNFVNGKKRRLELRFAGLDDVVHQIHHQRTDRKLFQRDLDSKTVQDIFERVNPAVERVNTRALQPIRYFRDAIFCKDFIGINKKIGLA